jgi:hypothetical protein
MVVSDDQIIREKSLPFFVSFFLKKKMGGSSFGCFEKRSVLVNVINV